MKNRLLSVWEAVRTSYWFVPAVLGIAAVILATIAIGLDRSYGPDLPGVLGWAEIETPEGARAVLSTIASSMITVAGVVFSLMMVVLSLAAQQYGHLVLRHFMRDFQNQLVLGVFTATFIYCLLVLRTISEREDSIFVPRVSGLIGVVLAVVDVAVLIYFIHHVADSIRSSTVVGRVSKELEEAIDDIFPVHLGAGAEEVGEPQPEERVPTDLEENSRPVMVSSSGYLEYSDDPGLMALAKEHDVILRLYYRPGDFMLAGSILARIWPADRADDGLVEAVGSTFLVGPRRAQFHGIDFLLAQLVEIGVRALSPSLNDPFTAAMVVDRISSALGLLGTRRLPSGYRFDDEGRLRAVAEEADYATLTERAFGEIRHYGSGDPLVARHMLDTLRRLGERVEAPQNVKALRNQAELMWDSARHRLKEEVEIQALERSYRAAMQVLAEEQA